MEYGYRVAICIEYFKDAPPGLALVSALHNHYLLLEHKLEYNQDGISGADVNKANRLWQSLDKMISSTGSVSSELDTVEEYSNFFSASRRAKELASRYNRNIDISRSRKGWTVFGPRVALSTIVPGVNSDMDPESDQDCLNNIVEEDYHKEFVQPLIEEFQDDLDSYSRSDEGGWFYED